MKTIPTCFSRRRDGQALVEFALVLPVLVLILFGIIEVSIVLHTYVRLNRMVRSIAVESARADVTMSRSPDVIIEYATRRIKREPTLRFLREPGRAKRYPGDFLAVDVNDQDEGKYFSKIELRYTVEALLLPHAIGGVKLGRWPIYVSCTVVNETQGKRQDAKGAYKRVRVDLSDLLETGSDEPNGKGGTPDADQ